MVTVAKELNADEMVLEEHKKTGLNEHAGLCTTLHGCSFS